MVENIWSVTDQTDKENMIIWVRLDARHPSFWVSVRFESYLQHILSCADYKENMAGILTQIISSHAIFIIVQHVRVNSKLCLIEWNLSIHFN